MNKNKIFTNIYCIYDIYCIYLNIINLKQYIMYDKNDLKVSGNEILVKEYDGSKINGVKYYVWKNLLTVNPQKCIYSLNIKMNELMNTFVK